LTIETQRHRGEKGDFELRARRSKQREREREREGGRVVVEKHYLEE